MQAVTPAQQPTQQVTLNKATKVKPPERIFLWGPSRSGRTATAIGIAKRLADGGAIGVIDFAGSNALEFGDQFTYHEPVTTLDEMIAKVFAMDKAGCKVIIVDLISVIWDGNGGVLAKAGDLIKKAQDEVKGFGKYKNSKAAYGDCKRPVKQALQQLRGIRAHLVVTADQTNDLEGNPKPVGEALLDVFRTIVQVVEGFAAMYNRVRVPLKELVEVLGKTKGAQ